MVLQVPPLQQLAVEAVVVAVGLVGMWVSRPPSGSVGRQVLPQRVVLDVPEAQGLQVVPAALDPTEVSQVPPVSQAALDAHMLTRLDRHDGYHR